MQIFVGKMATHPNLIHSKQRDNSNRDNIITVTLDQLSQKA